MIIIDGMADRSQRTLGGKTPLQAAHLPNLDTLAGRGACGHMHPVSPGICASSDQAHWRILGYGDFPYTGRAGIEAVGAGVDLERDDVVVRVTLATTMIDDDKKYVQIAPAYLPDDQASEIAAALSSYSPGTYKTRIHHLGGPFMVMVLSGGASVEVTDSDPLFFRLPVPPIVPFDCAPPGAAEKTAGELTRFSAWAEDVLGSHPVNEKRAAEGMTMINDVLLKWPSSAPSVPPFESAWGFNAVAAVSGDFYTGLARLLRMELKEIRRGNAALDLAGKLESAAESVSEGRDFAFIHTKAADEASHTGKPAKKVKVLEELDEAFALVVERFSPDPDILTVITADHATPSGGSEDVIHSGESVPVMMVGSNVRTDAVESFDEISCAAGSLGMIRGADIMPLILNFTDRARFGTSRITSGDIPYRPLE